MAAQAAERRRATAHRAGLPHLAPMAALQHPVMAVQRRAAMVARQHRFAVAVLRCRAGRVADILAVGIHQVAGIQAVADTPVAAATQAVVTDVADLETSRKKSSSQGRLSQKPWQAGLAFFGGRKSKNRECRSEALDSIIPCIA
jgi:hypothetical protein